MQASGAKEDVVNRIETRKKGKGEKVDRHTELEKPTQLLHKHFRLNHEWHRSRKKKAELR